MPAFIFCLSMKKIVKKWLLLTGILPLLAGNVIAQYPETEIYLFRYQIQKKQVILKKPQKVALQKGYNNQPSFVKNSPKILFVSQPEGESQTEVYVWDYQKKTLSRVTSTPESEFSPRVHQGKMTAVRIECGPDSVQRLWCFALSPDWKAENENVLFITRKGVGYYDWINDTQSGIFIVGDKDLHTLHLLDTERPFSDSLLATNIGRSVWKVPRKNLLSYIQKDETGGTNIQFISFTTKKKMPLPIPLLPEMEDFVWHPKGYLWALQDGKLWAWFPGKSQSWVEVADIASLGLGDFYRIALHPKGKKIALVRFEGKKP